MDLKSIIISRLNKARGLIKGRAATCTYISRPVHSINYLFIYDRNDYYVIKIKYLILRLYKATHYNKGRETSH